MGAVAGPFVASVTGKEEGLTGTAKQAASGAWKGLTHAEDAPDMMQLAAIENKRLYNEAVADYEADRAAKGLKALTFDAPPEEIKNAKVEIVERFRKKQDEHPTGFLLRHPARAEFALEFADPIMGTLSAEAGGIAKGAAKLIGMTDTGAAALQKGAHAAEWLKQAALSGKVSGPLIGLAKWEVPISRWASKAKLNVFQRGTPEAVEGAQEAISAASQARYALEKGMGEVNIVANEIENLLLPLDRVPKGDRILLGQIRRAVGEPVRLTLESDRLTKLANLDEARALVAGTRPELLPAFDSMEAAGKKFAAGGDQFGIMQEFKGETLEKTPLRPGWIPNKVFNKYGEKLWERQKADMAADVRAKGITDDLTYFSAKERDLPSHFYEADPLVQYKAALGSFRDRASKAGAVQNMQAWLGKEAQFVRPTPKELPPQIPGMGLPEVYKKVTVEEQLKYTGGQLVSIPADASPEVVQKFRSGLEENTGSIWIDLNSVAQKRLQELTGTPGTRRPSAQRILAPQDLAEKFDQIIPVTAGRPDAESSAYKALGNVIKYTAGFINAPTRIISTVGAGAWSYFGRNLAFVPGLSYIHRGFSALNPKALVGEGKVTLMLASGGDEQARAAMFKLRSGNEISYGRIADIMRSVGVDNMWKERMGVSIKAPIPQFLRDTVMEGLRKTPGGYDVARVLGNLPEHITPLMTPAAGPFKRFSSARLNAAVDNWQHIGAFVHALEDDTPPAIARALDVMSEYAGNANRMTPFEKNALREGGAFYTWTRFIAPHLWAQTASRPDKMAQFAKFRGFLDQEWGPVAPYSPEVIDTWMRGFGIASNEQPDKTIHAGKIGVYPSDERAYQAATITLEMPDSVGLGYHQILSGLGEAGQPNQRPLASLDSWAVNLGISLWTGYDMRGNPSPLLPAAYDWEALSQTIIPFADAKRGGTMLRAVFTPTARLSTGFRNLLIGLEQRKMPEMAADVVARYAVGAMFGPLTYGINAIAGGTVGYPQVIPGLTEYGLSPLEGASRRAEQAGKQFRLGKGMAKQVARTPTIEEALFPENEK